MKVFKETLVHPAKDVSYSVYLANNWENGLKEKIEGLNPSQVFIISQKGLEEIVVRGFLEASGYPESSVIYLEQGEKNKHLKNLGPVYNRLIEMGADRKSVIIALGGGVVGDFAGFVAATLLRGIRVVQLPSTLLAAVDSSVGGKVAVNVDRGKNMVGAFHHPEFVYFNINLLKTLEPSEWNCGLGEILKHACMDEPSMEIVDRGAENLRDPGSTDLADAVLASVQFKAKVVSQDEKESGLRSILNLGHTTGHALESLTSYSRFSHGEAISRGLVTMLLLSNQLKGLSEDTMETLLGKIARLGLPMDTCGFAGQDVWEHMKYDKKNESGNVRFVLLEGPGTPVYGCKITKEEFLTAWEKQKERFG